MAQAHFEGVTLDAWTYQEPVMAYLRYALLFGAVP